MSKVNEEELPMLNLFSIEDLQRMALGSMLGVTDMRSFLSENTIEYKAALKPNVGLAITITSVKPITPSSKNA